MIGAPGNQEGRGSLYSASINNPTFMSGRSVLPDAAGMNDPSIRDQYQGKVILELEIKYNTPYNVCVGSFYGNSVRVPYVP